MRQNMMDEGAMFEALPREHALDIVGWFEDQLAFLRERPLDQAAVIREFFEN